MYNGHVDGSFKIYDLSKSVLMSLIKPIDTIIDFGARHGESYDTFSQFYPRRYIMVEPISVCQEIIDFKNLRNVELVRGIVCSDSTERDYDDMFTCVDDNDQSSNLFSERDGRYGATKKERVKLIKESSLGCDRVNFAKINIESGEYDLIELDIFKKFESFVMEAHNGLREGFSYKDVIEKLKDDYELITYGNLDYKDCFIVGFRI